MEQKIEVAWRLEVVGGWRGVLTSGRDGDLFPFEDDLSGP